MKLGLLVVRLPRCGAIHRLLTPFAGNHRFLERVHPRAVELFDPGAMGEAPTGERHELGLRLAPTSERVRPLVRPPRLERLLAGGDHAAVDDAGEERRDLSRGDGDHRLVEELETLVHAPLLDQRRAGEMRRRREEIVFVEPRRDRGRLRGGVVRSLGVTGRHPLKGGRQEQVAGNDGILVCLLAETLGSPEPPHRRPHLACDREVHPEDDGCLRGRLRLTRVEAELVEPLERREVRVALADQRRRGRQQLDVGCFERRCRIRA